MAVSLSISITQNSQSVVNNTSNVTVKVTASWTGGSYNAAVNAEGVPQAKGWLKIDGTSYDFESTFNTGKTTTGSQTIFTKTVTVNHASDGKKTLSCSASYNTYVSAGTVTASASKALTTIPRKSTLTVSNGTLGTAQTLKVTRQATSFTHTITYSCGSASGTVCSKSTDESISWTPPMSLANQNTTGTSVTVKFTIITYSGTTNVGSNTKSITCYIPTTVKPSCTVSVTDPTGVFDKYGSYLQGVSKFKVVVTPKESYGSPISKTITTANGKVYTETSFTTDAITSRTSLSVTATVTDKRGRSGSATVDANVLPYTPPAIIKMTVRRCDENGDANDRGEFVQIEFSTNVSSLDGKNTAAYVIKYKRATDDKFTEVKLSQYNNVFTVTNGSYIFPADSGSSYNVELDVTDNHILTSRTTTASTGYTIMHFNASGDAIGIGKIAEIPDTLDIGMTTRFFGGLLYPVLEPDTDLNDVRTPNTYVGANASNNRYGNCPLTAGTFTLEVISAGENGQVLQRLIKCDKNAPCVYERFYYTNAWGAWAGGWITASLNSAFTMYGTSVSDNQPRYRKDGRLVEVRGVVAPTSAITGSTTIYPIFTLPEGYRPDSPIYVICQGSGNCTWLLSIKTNGEVGHSRYRNGDTAATAAAKTSTADGAWLPFQVTYFAK
jgi:hypothetical protein